VPNKRLACLSSQKNTLVALPCDGFHETYFKSPFQVIFMHYRKYETVGNLIFRFIQVLFSWKRS